MKTLIVYDSNYGNTAKIAEAIAAELGASAKNISAVSSKDIEDSEFLMVGTPIIGWKPTVNMQSFLDKLPDLKGLKASTFDTRVKLFIHGDAMGKVADALKSKGAEIIINPMPFYVAGPQAAPYLIDGELEKAKSWAKEINSKINKE